MTIADLRSLASYHEKLAAAHAVQNRSAAPGSKPPCVKFAEETCFAAFHEASARKLGQLADAFECLKPIVKNLSE